jgi:hypothetical protein
MFRRSLSLTVFTLLMFFFSLPLTAQELLCNVSISAQKIQGSYQEKFKKLQQDIYQFMNNTVWTNDKFAPNERIECTMLINLTEQVSSDQFKGTLHVQSSRPVYNTGYNTTMFNYLDNDFQFTYLETQPLLFDETTFLSNLTSVLAYYAYIIIGLDYDSFSMKGGTPYFLKAQQIVSNSQNAVEPGWQPFAGKRNRNRYWLIQNILDNNYAPVREFIYRYDRLGLDVMENQLAQGRAEIASSLELLRKVYRLKPDPYMLFLNVVLDAKRDEIINIFSESFPDEKHRVYMIMKEVDPANTQKYDKLVKNQ